MSAGGGRARARGRIVQRTALIAAALVLLTLILLASGHWIVAIIVAVPAIVAVWLFFQARSVR